MEAGHLRWTDITPPKYLDRDEKARQEIREKGHCVPYEKEFIRKDGSRVPILLAVATLGEGIRDLAAAVALDLTELKKIEDVERRQRRITDSILSSISEGIIVADEHGKIVLFNRAAEELHGADMLDSGPEEWATLNGLYLPDQVTLYPAQDLPLSRALRGETVADTELFVRTPRAPLGVWHSTTARPLRNEAGENCGGVVVFRDITERKRIEEQMRQSQKMEAFGKLAGGIAHDFNNHLTVICGCSKVLLDSVQLDDPARELLQEIGKAGERSVALTRQLLAFGRKQVLAPQISDLREIVAGVEKMLRRIIGEDIELNIFAHSPLDCIQADPAQLEQVLLNLAVNSRDAMPHGGRLTIAAQNTELDEPYAQSHAGVQAGPHALLIVRDTGCGMTPEVMQHIFEPFFTTKPLGEGTGLGLASVYGIVEQSGGHITASSEPGKGTTFRIYFPSIAAAPSGGKK